MTLKSKNEDIRSVAFGSITGSFANLGSATTNPAYCITVFNGTDAQIQVSKDGGSTTWVDLPPLGAICRDFGKKTEQGVVGLVAVGTQFQVKYSGSAPTEGTLSITVEYMEKT